MEFEVGHHKTVQWHLQQQVAEQSHVCDVTVKRDTWERKYHQCVLMSSPFFECIFRNDFIERSTGVIKLNVGSPSTIDAALMFLYGEAPTINNQNIAALIDLAEFFAIPKLKSACVKWLKRQTVALDVCLAWIELSSLYDFELPECIRYIESNLPGVLEQDSSCLLTEESLGYIFNTRKFCYLQMEDRLKFLIRWFKANPSERKYATKELLSTIDLRYVTLSDAMKLDVESITGQCPHTENDTSGDDVLTEVLVSRSGDKLMCYDIARNSWFNIHNDIDCRSSYVEQEGLTTNPNYPEIYQTELSYGGTKFVIYNIDSRETKTYGIVNETGMVVKSSLKFYYGPDTCIFYKSERVQIKLPGREGHPNLDNLLPGKAGLPNLYNLRLLNLFGRINVSELIGISGGSVYKDTDEVAIGTIVDDKVQIAPLFSVAELKISSVAVNSKCILGMISASQSYMLVYDIRNCTMDKVHVNTNPQDRIFSTNNGFIIHDNKRCITVERLSGADLYDKYCESEFSLKGETYRPIKHYFCNDIWYRFLQGSDDSGYNFQCIDHRSLKEAGSANNVVWKELSLPKESCSSYTLNETLHYTHVPRRLLRCHVECPHCEYYPQRYQRRFSSSVVFVDRDVYDGSFDDAYNVYFNSDDYNDYYY